MAELIATRALTYGTRRLTAGDAFQARPRDARILLAIGKARVPAAEPAEPPAVDDDDDLDALRAEAAELGVEVDGRWKEKRLRAEIEKARGAE